jgi:hypothetical protein|tara:strand:+ start:1383 stop:1694 length:312 start_codon:yes stop_codon:yes gene_type:complete
MQKDLWFNQDGEDKEEEFTETITGDEIDKFSKTGAISLSHAFDENGVPEEIKITLRAEECEFLRVELKDSLYDLNFAQTQGEIDDIYEKIEVLEEALSKENCN